MSIWSEVWNMFYCLQRFYRNDLKLLQINDMSVNILHQAQQFHKTEKYTPFSFSLPLRNCHQYE